VYAIPAWGGFLPADLKSHINGFLRHLHRYGYTSTVFNVDCRTTEDCRWQLVTCSLKLRNNKRNINHKCNMQSVAKKWDGKMHYEPCHF